jgi:hypothetical protein
VFHLKATIFILLGVILTYFLVACSGTSQNTQSIPDHQANATHEITNDVSKNSLNNAMALFVGGRAVYIDPPLRMVENKLFAPIQPISDSLGSELRWNENTSTATIILGDIGVATELGVSILTIRNMITGDTDTLAISVAPRRFDGVVFVPIEYIAYVMGLSAQWDLANDTFHISTTDNDSSAPASERIDDISTDMTVVAADNSSSLIGSVVQFGGNEWRVIDVDSDGNLLILSELIISERYFHNTWRGSTTWERSDIRQYLNTSFYNSFSMQERGRILETSLSNDDNPWFSINGGNDTLDKIFLLSLDEV